MRAKTKKLMLLAALPSILVLPISRIELPSQYEQDRAKLFLSRATYGAHAGDRDAILAMGTESWLEKQLSPTQTDDSEAINKLASFENITLSTSELMSKYPRPTRAEREAMQKERQDAESNGKSNQGRRRSMEEGPGRILRELSQAKLVRAAYSENQLLEVMTDFWFNHFNVYARKNANTLFAIPSYEKDVIRENAFGRFEDLVVATAQHPAMLFYLDNWVNMKEGFDPFSSQGAMGRQRRQLRRPEGGNARTFGINENYARELMELHTLGVDGGYDENDVREVARAFTGWSVIDPRRTMRLRERNESMRRRGRSSGVSEFPAPGTFYFNAPAHDTDDKTVLGTTINEKGLGDGLAVIRLLSQHPSTARFISTKLAKKFVSDSPSDALVSEMSEVFIRTEGDIKAVLRTMFLSTRFVEESMSAEKVKTPLEFVVSAIRLTGADVVGPGLSRTLQELGMPLYLCQPPTGYTEASDMWLTGGSLLARAQFAEAFVSGNTRGVHMPADKPDSKTLILSLTNPDFQRQ